MKETKPSEQFDIHSLDQLFSMIGKSSDFSRIQLETGHNGLTLSFYPSCRTAARFTIICSQASTVENLSINLHLMRRQSAIPQLVFEELTIGSLSKTTIAIAYIEGLTNPDIVQTMKDRLKGTVLDIVYDSSFPRAGHRRRCQYAFPALPDHGAHRPDILCHHLRPDRVVYERLAICTGGSSNLHLFLHDYYAEGKDPSMPSLTSNEQLALSVHGTAKVWKG